MSHRVTRNVQPMRLQAWCGACHFSVPVGDGDRLDEHTNTRDLRCGGTGLAGDVNQWLRNEWRERRQAVVIIDGLNEEALGAIVRGIVHREPDATTNGHRQRSAAFDRAGDAIHRELLWLAAEATKRGVVLT